MPAQTGWCADGGPRCYPTRILTTSGTPEQRWERLSLRLRTTRQFLSRAEPNINVLRERCRSQLSFASEVSAGVPMAKELWQRSAVELGEAYRKDECTPVDVLDAVLRRIERVNPVINAFVTLDLSGARRSAEASAKRWQTRRAFGPLDGVPISVKDNIPVQGLRSTWGSRLYENFVPDVDELPIARLRSRGAIVLGKTNCPEFTLQGYTDNLLFGPTRNPWDPALTPGGSSGGAVAAVAAGLGPIAVATDGGGINCRPSFHTGLGWLKTLPGRVPPGGWVSSLLLDFQIMGPTWPAGPGPRVVVR